jgi:hypothetical protein
MSSVGSKPHRPNLDCRSSSRRRGDDRREDRCRVRALCRRAAREKSQECQRTHTCEAQPNDLYGSRRDDRRSVDQSVLEDRETSAIESHLGTWQEEVARIVSAGFKPGSGVDLQLDRGGVVELYAIQSAPNTKSAGGRRSDVDALRRAAGAIRASKRRVELYIAVLSGRRVTRPLKSARIFSSSPRMSFGSA